MLESFFSENWTHSEDVLEGKDLENAQLGLAELQKVFRIRDKHSINWITIN